MRAHSRFLPLFLVAMTGERAAAQTPAPPRVPTPAVAGQPRTYDGAIAMERRFILDTMRRLGAPGASVTVMKDGNVLWSEGFGWADLEQRVAVTPLTRFRIGSVSKSLISLGLGLLIHEGKIDLDAPIQRYEPLGLRHTVAEYVDSLIPFRAHFYTRADSGNDIINATYVDNSCEWAGGGFLSTTEDLARLGELLLDGAILKPETRQMPWTSQRTADGKETGYGMGWFVDHDAAGRRRVFHSGGSVGGAAYLLIYPDQKLVLVLLVNSDRTFVRAAPHIAEAFLGSR